MVFMWFSCGVPVVFQWFSDGFPIVFLSSGALLGGVWGHPNGCIRLVLSYASVGGPQRGPVVGLWKPSGRRLGEPSRILGGAWGYVLILVNHC